jgi:hypothetical protein
MDTQPRVWRVAVHEDKMLPVIKILGQLDQAAQDSLGACKASSNRC